MSTPNHSPDGLTYEDITALQRDVTAELRREAGLPRPRHHRCSASCRPRDAAHDQTTRSPRDPAARRSQRREEQQ